MFNYKKKIQESLELLNEVKFSGAKMDRAIGLIDRLVQKKIGKTYRFGGRNGTVDLGSGKTGYLFFFSDKRAYRINTKSGLIYSVSIWKNFSVSKNVLKAADFTISIPVEMNIIKFMDELVDHIRTPRPGKYEFYVIPESKEFNSKNVLTEAKRLSHAEFVDHAKNYYGNVSSIKEKDIRELSKSLGISIPSSIWKTKAGRGRWDLTKDIGDVEVSARKTEQTPILHLQITGQDPETKKFFSAKGDKTAQNLMKEIQAKVMSNTATPEERDPKNHVETSFRKMINLTKIVARGRSRAFVITGGPGIGKTYEVTSAIKEEGLQKGKDWLHVKGKITASSLYQTLLLNRDKLIVFDDADSVFGNDDAVNILKAVLDTSPVRTVSWISPRTRNVSRFTDQQKVNYLRKFESQVSGTVSAEADEEDEDQEEGGRKKKEEKLKPPSEFDFTGRIIFISNIPQSKFDSAILSRSFNIDMDLTDREIFIRMESILPYLKLETGEIVSEEEKREVLKIIKDKNQLGSLKRPNLRMFVLALEIKMSGIPDWKELIENI